MAYSEQYYFIVVALVKGLDHETISDPDFSTEIASFSVGYDTCQKAIEVYNNIRDNPA